ncbi:hypothetical protein IG193_00555 [Infirmifilum lucidum]|uniref:Uncharacterized protein n=1 Tax=Infirmifilum lucidum TaxID=2776706 RepID=A0A7L9FH73_9CREN|nr:hypothetical protein [Infirmifilum lucidum]QOJ78991.1 hypothetical protein IG193_00555 [Infirmifilum lucidum]
MGRKVFLRGIDEKVYAEAKARAAQLGITVSEAVNIALKAWLESSHGHCSSGPTSAGHGVGDEQGVRYRVVANDGEFEETFDRLEDALAWLRKLYSEGRLRNSYIEPLGAKRARIIEVGMGYDELRGTV